MKKGIIYCYHCIDTGKKYIGQTTQEEIRRKRHLIESKKTYSKFYNAVRKYGWDKFIYGIIEEFDISDLDEKEIYYISFYDTYKNGYNMTIGGDGRRKYTFQSQREYYEFYMSKNSDKIREKQRIYYKNNKDKKKEYYEKNRDKKLEYLREWRSKNKDKVKEYNKNFNYKEYYWENVDKIRENYKKHYEKKKNKRDT